MYCQAGRTEESVNPFWAQELILLPSGTILWINSTYKHLYKTLVSNTDNIILRCPHMDIRTCHNIQRTMQTFMGKRHMLPSPTSGKCELHQKMCNLHIALEAVSKKHHYCSVLTQINWYHNGFSTPGRKYLFTYQSHICFLTVVCRHQQTRSLWDSRIKSPSSLRPTILYMPVMNPAMTMPNVILFQTSVIFFGNPSKPRARKQWLFLKRLNLLNSILTDGKTTNVYIRPHEIWTVDIPKTLISLK